MELCGSVGPTNNKNTGLLADVDPVALDKSIKFSNIGGLERHITCLKEMVVFPILYPEVFEQFGVTPPKGVLFHGPPGIDLYFIFFQILLNIYFIYFCI